MKPRTPKVLGLLATSCHSWFGLVSLPGKADPGAEAHAGRADEPLTDKTPDRMWPAGRPEVSTGVWIIKLQVKIGFIFVLKTNLFEHLKHLSGRKQQNE